MNDPIYPCPICGEPRPAHAPRQHVHTVVRAFAVGKATEDELNDRLQEIITAQQALDARENSGAAVPSLTGERLSDAIFAAAKETQAIAPGPSIEWLRNFTGKLFPKLPGLGGSVPEGPPPEGPWRIRPYPIMGKHSPMDGWWQVLRGGMHTGHPQPSGSFETHDEALAVRDALNSLAGAPRGLGRDPQ